MLFSFGKKSDFDPEDVIESMGEELIVINENYEIIYANKLKRNEFGEDITGKTCYEVFEERSEPCKYCPTLKAITDKTLIRADWEYTHGKTGEKCVASLIATPIIHDGKFVPYAVEVVRNSTIRKKAYEITIELQKVSTEKEIINLIMNASIDNLGFKRARFYVAEKKEDYEILRLTDCRGMQNSDGLYKLEDPVNVGKSGEALSLAKPIFFKICNADEEKQKNENEKNPFVVWIRKDEVTNWNELEKDKYPMWIDLPLIVGSRAIGKLSLDKMGSDWDIGEYNLQILGMLAIGIAQALEKARLSELNVLMDISTALLYAERDLHKTLDIILKEGLEKRLF